MGDDGFDHRVVFAVEMLVALWIGSQVVRSYWFRASLVVVATPLVVRLVWWRYGSAPEGSEAVRRLALYGAAGLGAAWCYRSTRTFASVPHAVFGLALAAHVAVLESTSQPTQEPLLLAALALWCAREFQRRSVAAALCVTPLAATALWRVYRNSLLRSHHVALLANLGWWNATSMAAVGLRGRQWVVDHRAELSKHPVF